MGDSQLEYQSPKIVDSSTTVNPETHIYLGDTLRFPDGYIYEVYANTQFYRDHVMGAVIGERETLQFPELLGANEGRRYVDYSGQFERNKKTGETSIFVDIETLHMRTKIPSLNEFNDYLRYSLGHELRHFQQHLDGTYDEDIPKRQRIAHDKKENRNGLKISRILVGSGFLTAMFGFASPILFAGLGISLLARSQVLRRKNIEKNLSEEYMNLPTEKEANEIRNMIPNDILLYRRKKANIFRRLRAR